MKVYLSGPMSGAPRYNFDAFFEAAEDLRSQGYEVISPAEMDIEAGINPDDAGQQGKPAEYAFFLARDIQVIAEEKIEGIVVLPNWENSGGAKTEVMFALALGLPIISYPTLVEYKNVGMYAHKSGLGATIPMGEKSVR